MEMVGINIKSNSTNQESFFREVLILILIISGAEDIFKFIFIAFSIILGLMFLL